MTVLERLDKIHPDMISGFLTTGKCNGIPERCAEIFETNTMGGRNI